MFILAVTALLLSTIFIHVAGSQTGSITPNCSILSRRSFGILSLIKRDSLVRLVDRSHISVNVQFY